jgi:hypothetical protein
VLLLLRLYLRAKRGICLLGRHEVTGSTPVSSTADQGPYSLYHVLGRTGVRCSLESGAHLLGHVAGCSTESVGIDPRRCRGGKGATGDSAVVVASTPDSILLCPCLQGAGSG